MENLKTSGNNIWFSDIFGEFTIEKDMIFVEILATTDFDIFKRKNKRKYEVSECHNFTNQFHFFCRYRYFF